MLGGLGLARVLLRGIVHVGHVVAAEQGVVVERHLGVKRQHPVVLGDHQRIDLEHGGIAIAEGAISIHDGRDRALRLLDAKPELEGELARLKGLQAHGRLDHHLEDGFGLGPGDLLDLHAAALRGDHADALRFAVEYVAEIELAVERLGHLNIDPLHGLAFGPSLDGDEALAEQGLRRVADLVIGLADLDAPGLAARARVDLGLHRPAPAAKLGRRVNRLIGAEGDGALGHRHAEGRQQFLGLILVDVHVFLPLYVWPGAFAGSC